MKLMNKHSKDRLADALASVAVLNVLVSSAIINGELDMDKVNLLVSDINEKVESVKYLETEGLRVSEALKAPQMYFPARRNTGTSWMHNDKGERIQSAPQHIDIYRNAGYKMGMGPRR